MGKAIIIQNADFSQAGLGTVTINGIVPVYGLTIKGPVEFYDEAYFFVSYYPLNTTQKGVIWSVIEGSTYATINSLNGKLSVVQNSGGGAVKIKATSVFDNNVFSVFDTIVYESGTAPFPIEGRRLQGFDNAYLNATKYYSGPKVFPCEDTTFEIDFITPSNRGYARSIYGGMLADSGTGQWIHGVILAYSASAGSAFRIDDYCYTAQGEASTRPFFEQAATHRVKYTRTGRNYSVDINGTVLTGVVGSGIMETPLEIYLFAGYSINGGTVSANNIADGLQIYSAKMTMNGNDVFNLFPAEWDGVVGMWDRVSNKLIGPEANGYFSLVDNI